MRTIAFYFIVTLLISCNESKNPPTSDQNSVSTDTTNEPVSKEDGRIISFLEDPSNFGGWEHSLKYFTFYKKINDFGESELKYSSPDNVESLLKFSKDFTQIKLCKSIYSSSINQDVLTIKGKTKSDTFNLYYTEYGILAINQNANAAKPFKDIPFFYSGINVGFLIIAGDSESKINDETSPALLKLVSSKLDK